MSDITKKIGRHIPSNQRQQIFTNADAVEGDILLIKDSLGRPARKINITATDVVRVRFNVRHFVLANRDAQDGLYEGDAPNLVNSKWTISTENALIVLDAGDTYELENDFPVNDIQLQTVSGVFEIIAS